MFVTLIFDSVAGLLATANQNPGLLEYLATSSEFVENLDQFLQYNPIPCPQLRYPFFFCSIYFFSKFLRTSFLNFILVKF